MKRIKSLDLMRVICFAMIVFYHMAVELQKYGLPLRRGAMALCETPNIHIAKLSVALFFILSGVSLTYSQKGKDVSPWKFYRSRFFRILVPYYIVYIVTLVLLCIAKGGIKYIFAPGIPFSRILVTLFGMDGWIGMHGYATFNLGIGEWFLGCLVFFYMLYPWLRMFMQKYPKAFMSAITCLYLAGVFLYRGNVEPHMNAAMKLFEFCLGMLFGEYAMDAKLRWEKVSIPVFLIFLLCPFEIPLPQAIKITIYASACFLSLYRLEAALEKRSCTFLTFMAGISYEIFLVHHVILYHITVWVAPMLTGAIAVFVCMLLEVLGIIALSLVLHRLTKRKN